MCTNAKYRNGQKVEFKKYKAIGSNVVIHLDKIKKATIWQVISRSDGTYQYYAEMTNHLQIKLEEDWIYES